MNGADVGTACMWEAYRWLVILGSVSAGIFVVLACVASVVIALWAYFVVVIDGNGRISRRLRKWRYLAYYNQKIREQEDQDCPRCFPNAAPWPWQH